jgi:hypothetical protein
MELMIEGCRTLLSGCRPGCRPCFRPCLFVCVDGGDVKPCQSLAISSGLRSVDLTEKGFAKWLQTRWVFYDLLPPLLCIWAGGLGRRYKDTSCKVKHPVHCLIHLMTPFSNCQCGSWMNENLGRLVMSSEYFWWSSSCALIWDSRNTGFLIRQRSPDSEVVDDDKKLLFGRLLLTMITFEIATIFF